MVLQFLLQLPQGESAKSGSDKAVITEKGSDNAYSLYQKINSTDPLAELIEQITCTCIADDVFALTGLFVLLASVLLTKNIHTEIPSEHSTRSFCAREGAAERGSRDMHRDAQHRQRHCLVIFPKTIFWEISAPSLVVFPLIYILEVYFIDKAPNSQIKIYSLMIRWDICRLSVHPSSIFSAFGG